MVGVLLQLAVLLFAGMTTYYPPWKLQKDGREIQSYAFPLTAAGTLTMSSGMLICSFVVEQSSKKAAWKANGEDCQEARILWLQRHRVVSGQPFESFAIFARGKRNSILASHRRDTSASAPDSVNTYDDNERKILPRLSKLVVVGALASFVGFVIQFTGLRAMNWSISIMQLAAALFMACLRSWVRRDLTEPLITLGIPTDHEIDWLATRLARCHREHWPDDEEHFENFQHGDLEWNIVNGAGATAQFNPKSDYGDGDDEMLAQRVMKVRAHLGQICRWTGPASELAVSIAKSVEDTLNILFPGEDSNIFVWSLKAKVGTNVGVEQNIHFTVRREEKHWTASATELEAALSLWLFAAHEEEERQSSKGNSKDKEGWLRYGETAATKQCMRILCRSTAQSLRNLSWWIPSGVIQLLCVKQLNGSRTHNLCDSIGIVELDNYRIVEGPECEVEPKAAHGITQYQSESLGFGSGISRDQRQPGNSFLVVISNDALAVILARSLFSSFLSATADRINIGVEATVSQGDPADVHPDAWQSLKLENSILLQIAQAVERAGLGNLQEAYTCIIPPLHLKNTLPSPLEIIDLAQRHARPEESIGHWQKAGAVYRWLFQISSTFDSRDIISIKAIAQCMEFYKQLNTTAMVWKRQHRKKEESRGLENLRLSLLNDLKTADKDITSHLAWMYEQRLALDGLEDLRLAGNEMRLNLTLLKENLGHSPLHQALLSPVPHKMIQANSLIEGGNPDQKDILGWTPLHLAATRGERLVMSLLLHSGADPNSKNIAGWTPLHYFSFRKDGNPKVAWRFLQKGADVDSCGRDGLSPLHCAAMCDNQMMTKLLIESGANVEIQDNFKKTALHWAARNGSPEAIQVLFAKGAYLDSQEYNRMTPLHLAASNGQEGIVVQLVKLGANILAQDKFGYNSLHWAAEAGDGAMIEKLLALGARINTKNVYAQVALHIAAHEGREAATEKLLEFGADANAKDTYGQTPLHLAAGEGYETVVEMLVNLGADINVKDVWKKTAFNCAVEKGHGVVARRLKELGADLDGAERSGSEDSSREIYE